MIQDAATLTQAYDLYHPAYLFQPALLLLVAAVAHQVSHSRRHTVSRNHRPSVFLLSHAALLHGSQLEAATFPLELHYAAHKGKAG